MTGVLEGEARRLRCIEAVEADGARFGVLARELHDRSGLDVVVPWVPAWRAKDLVGHLGRVHRWATYIVRAGSLEAPPPEARPEPPDDGLPDWYREGHAALVTTLRDTAADSPAWHMSPAAGRTAADWARRQAHELVVHRMDLEAAVGAPHAPVATDLAEDGIDELLSVVLPRWAHTDPLVTATATVSVRARESGRTWTVRVDRGTVTVEPAASPTTDAAVEGDATDLLLHLWGRPADRLTVTGDATAEGLLRGR